MNPNIKRYFFKHYFTILFLITSHITSSDHHENADEIRAEDAKDNSTEHLLEEEKTIHDPTHHELTNATTLPGNESTNGNFHI